MAEFTQLVVTRKGKEALADALLNGTAVNFTKISASSKMYAYEQLETLESIEGEVQENLISGKSICGDSVMLETAFTNTELQEGYYIRTIGLYAEDKESSEFLYGAAVENTGNCYMPRYNGKTVSGVMIKLSAAVSNTENISMIVNPAAVATVQDMEKLQGVLKAVQISLQALPEYVDETYRQSTGYTDQKIADLINGAPSTLDTLGEIAQVMSENADVVSALNEAIGKKANEAEFDSHVKNAVKHVTEEERSTWNAAADALGGFRFYPATLTQAEYDALPGETKKTEGMLFVIRKE